MVRERSDDKRKTNGKPWQKAEQGRDGRRRTGECGGTKGALPQTLSQRFSNRQNLNFGHAFVPQNPPHTIYAFPIVEKRFPP
jgi:hypothetical protein